MWDSAWWAVLIVAQLWVVVLLAGGVLFTLRQRRIARLYTLAYAGNPKPPRNFPPGQRRGGGTAPLSAHSRKTQEIRALGLVEPSLTVQINIESDLRGHINREQESIIKRHTQPKRPAAV